MYFILRKTIICLLGVALISTRSLSQIETNGETPFLPPIRMLTQDEEDSLIEFFSKESLKFYSYSIHDLDSGYTYPGISFNGLVVQDSLLPIFEIIINTTFEDYIDKEDQFFLVDSLLKDSFESIFLKLKPENNPLPLKKLNAKERQKIWKQIQSFQISKEKIALMIAYFEFSIEEKITIKDIDSLYTQLYNETSKISDLYDRGTALVYVGDFFNTHYFWKYSIYPYYLAQVYYSLSNRDSIYKNSAQGFICEKFTKIFPMFLISNYSAVSKKIQFHIAAKGFFERSGLLEYANRSVSKCLYTYSLQCFEKDEIPAKKIDRKHIISTILSYLASLYPDGIDEKSAFRWFNIIGNVLRANQKYEEAKAYYHRALLLALVTKDFYGVTESLQQISLNYAQLGNGEYAVRYSQLLSNLAKKINKKQLEINADLVHLNVLYFLKKWDSVLLYADRFLNQYDNEKTRSFLFFIEALTQVYELRYKAYEFLKSDSVAYFRDKLQQSRVLLHSAYLDVLLYESAGMSYYMGYLKDYQKDAELILNNKLSMTNRKLIVVSCLLVLSITGLFIFFRRNIKQSRRLRANFEEQIVYKSISSHDIRRISRWIPHLIKNIYKEFGIDGQLKQNLIRVERAAEYIHSTYLLSSKDSISLDDQIRFSKVYAELFKNFKLPNDYSINIRNHIQDKRINFELPMPPLLINNFIKNSIEHGFEGQMVTALDVTIKSKSIKGGFVLIIEDNGCGINYAKNRGGTPGKGIGLAKSLIDVFNRENRLYRIEFSEASIKDKSDNNLGRGTIVELTFKRRI